MTACSCPTCGQPMPGTPPISTAGLTRKQGELLTFLDAQERRGITPSFEEMQAHLGLQSKSGVHRLITALDERGRIRRIPHRARAIEVVRSQGAPA